MNDAGSGSVLVDPLIDEVRQRRRDLLASCGNHFEALARLIRTREAEHHEGVADPRSSQPVRAETR